MSKPEIIVDPREARAARSAILIEREAAAIDRPVVVELDGRLEVLQGLAGPVLGLLADRIVKVSRRIERVELLGDPVLLGVERVALLLEIGLAEIGPEQRVVRNPDRPPPRDPAVPRRARRR